jgi:hypothetical protein
VRQILGKRKVPERGLRTPASCRNRRITAAGAADFGERFAQPGGTIWREKKGKVKRRGRAFIGKSRGSFWCLNLLGMNSGRRSLAAEVTAALMAGGGRRC